MFPVKFTPLFHTNKDVLLQSRFSWACFRRPGCLFLSWDLATLAVTLIFGALSFMTAPACVVAVCHLSPAMLTWNIPCCLVNTTANPVSHHVVADRTHFPSNILLMALIRTCVLKICIFMMCDCRRVRFLTYHKPTSLLLPGNKLPPKCSHDLIC